MGPRCIRSIIQTASSGVHNVAFSCLILCQFFHIINNECAYHICEQSDRGKTFQAFPSSINKLKLLFQSLNTLPQTPTHTLSAAYRGLFCAWQWARGEKKTCYLRSDVVFQDGLAFLGSPYTMFFRQVKISGLWSNNVPGTWLDREAWKPGKEDSFQMKSVT